MRVLFRFYFFLGITIFTQTAVCNEKTFGILVQVKDQKVLQSKALKDLIQQNGLSDGEYYPSLKIKSFDSKTKKTQELKALCETITKFSDVLSCELNLELKPQSESACPSALSIVSSEFENDISRISNVFECDLFRKKIEELKDYQSPPGLSPFWAQEYIGSDLLKEEMSQKRIDTSRAAQILGVWDSSSQNHGEHVTNLIAGPFASSLIHLDRPLIYANLEQTSDYLKAYEKALRQCKKRSLCPGIINNSMYWRKSSQVAEVVKQLSAQGTVFVTAAGNDSGITDHTKRKSSQEGYSIIVTSHAPDGLSSEFSNYAPEVDISAPSNYEIISFDHQGQVRKFSGTSGATPLVTSTLLAFELITGLKLTTPQFKDLLKKTAITYKEDPQRVVTGAGYLNAYKMGAIAFRLVEACKEFLTKPQRDQCIQQKLGSQELYDFRGDIQEDDIIQNIGSAFPSCGLPSDVNKGHGTCEQKESALRKLRKASFLDSANSKYWEMLACVHREENLPMNARYYSGLASGTRFSEIVDKALSNADIADLLSNPENLKTKRDLILAAIRQNRGAFRFAHKDLMKDREVVLAAVRQNGDALELAHEELRNDPEIVSAAQNSMW